MGRLFRRAKRHSHFGLVGDMLSYGSIHILKDAVPLITLPIYTRVLTVGEYGALDIILTVDALIILLSFFLTQGIFAFIMHIKGTGIWMIM